MPWLPKPVRSGRHLLLTTSLGDCVAFLRRGTHFLTLTDSMGFGWMGANASIHLSGFGAVDLVDASSGAEATHVAIPSPSACMDACPDPAEQSNASGSSSGTCVQRLFDPETRICTSLRSELGCTCEGCCPETATARDEWRRALPTSNTSWWQRQSCEGSSDPSCHVVQSQTFRFEVYDMRGTRRRPAYDRLLAQQTFPCFEGLQEATLTHLAMVNRQAYAVAVYAFDAAGNEVVGCGSAGESRGRQTDQEAWQRAVIIDTSGPVLDLPTGRPIDVNLYGQGCSNCTWATPSLPGSPSSQS